LRNGGTWGDGGKILKRFLVERNQNPIRGREKSNATADITEGVKNHERAEPLRGLDCTTRIGGRGNAGDISVAGQRRDKPPGGDMKESGENSIRLVMPPEGEGERMGGRGRRVCGVGKWGAEEVERGGGERGGELEK